MEVYAFNERGRSKDRIDQRAQRVRETQEVARAIAHKPGGVAVLMPATSLSHPAAAATAAQASSSRAKVRASPGAAAANLAATVYSIASAAAASSRHIEAKPPLGGLEAAKKALLPIRVSYEHRHLQPDILKALPDLWICIWG